MTLMVNVKIKHDCSTELHEADLRATPARIALMNFLESSDKPMDVQTMIEFLQKRDIKTDPATVFRIVNMFTEKGLTKQIQLNEGKFRYELASKEDHHHLICNHCGSIEDISDCGVDTLTKEIQTKKKFKVTSHSLEFYGICANCEK